MSPFRRNSQAPTYSANRILFSGLSLTLAAKYLQLTSSVPLIILFITVFLSIFLPYTCRFQDPASKRRRLWQDFLSKEEICTKGPLRDEWLRKKNVVQKEGYWVNARGMCLSTTTILPPNGKPKAVIFFCHGYLQSASFISRTSLYTYAESSNVAVVGLDYEGHGLSDGVYTFIKEFDVLVTDVLDYFREVVQNDFPDTPRFLLGMSMGGTVAYFVQKKLPSLFPNVIFIAPMFKLKDELRNVPAENILKFILNVKGGRRVFGMLPVSPVGKLCPPKIPEVEETMQNSPYWYPRRGRLNTALECFNAMIELTKTCHEFNANCLILHGLDDEITCPTSSQHFYDVCRSSDKTLRLLDGMDHNLVFGETSENISKVFAEVNKWIESHIS